MAGEERRGADKLIEQAKETVDRLAEALDTLLNGQRPAPALVPVRRPSPEEIRPPHSSPARLLIAGLRMDNRRDRRGARVRPLEVAPARWFLPPGATSGVPPLSSPTPVSVPPQRLVRPGRFSHRPRVRPHHNCGTALGSQAHCPERTISRLTTPRLATISLPDRLDSRRLFFERVMSPSGRPRFARDERGASPCVAGLGRSATNLIASGRGLAGVRRRSASIPPRVASSGR
jgi:hypothetical protein